MDERVQVVAASLMEARRTGKKVARLAEDARPRDEREAALVRDAVMRLAEARHAGWKVALSPAGDVTASPVLSSGLLASPAQIAIRREKALGIETELAFRMKRAFPGPGETVSPRSILDAFDAVMPAVEILDSRYEAGFASPRLDLLADHLGNFGIVLGSALVGWGARDLSSVSISLELTGSGAGSVRGVHPLGDPIAPLLALAKHLALEGRSIAAGDVVITGSWTGVRQISVGSVATVRIDGDAVLELSVGDQASIRGGV